MLFGTTCLSEVFEIVELNFELEVGGGVRGDLCEGDLFAV